MAFTKIAAAGIGSTGTITLQHVVVTGSVETPVITGAASTANVSANSLVVSGVSTLGNVVATTGTFSGNVSIAGTLTYEDVTNIDSVGLITARSGVVVNTGTATTALVVNGSARITGILTIGTSSVTLDGTNNQVNVGTGVTIHHTNGVQVGGNTLHSSGLTVNSLNASGIVTASSFRGDGSQLTGIAATTNVRTNSLVVSGVSTFAAGSVSAPSISPTGDSNTGLFFPDADTIAFAEGGVEALRIDSSANVGIGTNVSNGLLSLSKASGRLLTLRNSTTGFGANDGSYLSLNGSDLQISNAESANLILYTNDIERVRLDTNGRVGVNLNPISGLSRFYVQSTDADTYGIRSGGTGSSGGVSAYSNFYADGGTPNNTSNRYGYHASFGQSLLENVYGVYVDISGLYNTQYGIYSRLSKNLGAFTSGMCYYADLSYSGSGGTPYFGIFYNRTDNLNRFVFKTNGGLDNYSGNNTNLCDIREKKNIEDLNSTWDCLKHWEIKKFHYNQDEDTDNKRYGVIAQQVQEHCPEVIDEWVKQVEESAKFDDNGNEIEPAKEKITRMGVKEQQMYWMAIKALQEAQERIETLEAQNAALTARLDAAGI